LHSAPGAFEDMVRHGYKGSTRSPSPSWRGEPFSEDISHFVSELRVKRVPSLSGLRTPFDEHLLLPPIALSRKARAGVSDLDLNSSSQSRTSSKIAGGLTASRSVPSLPTISSPQMRASAAEHRHHSVSRGHASRASKRNRSQCATMTKSPSVTSSPGSNATTTPSTALGSPASRLGLASPSDAGTNSTSLSCSRALTPTSLSLCNGSPKSLKWRRGDEIGSGSYGQVYQAQCKNTGHIFAVKVAGFHANDDKTLCEKLQQELDICQNLRHRHIVACLGHEFVNHSLHIYLEYVPGGSLRHMVNQFGALEGPLLGKATRGMLKGLNYLHQCNPPVVHRDLKGANVLIDLDFCVKLADFGCSKCDAMSKSFSKVGSIHWVAPEVLQDAGHGRRADVWSLGCVVIEIATASDPWGTDAFDNIMQAMFVIASSKRTPPLPDVLSESARSMVSCCLQRSPEDRSTASQLLRHEFFQSDTTTSVCCFSRPGSKSSVAA